MDINEILERLFSLGKFGIKMGLENTINFLNLLGNPQNNYKTFHIAGSNGKGSTSSFLSSILIENGYKTGLYTSPHFVRFNERIRINGVEVPDDYVAEFYLKHEEYIFRNKLTFFEVTTAMAYQYFSNEKVEYAVIETGLGGRLDSTNVITPLASIITSISLEHTNILGETIEEIASEKAGIIKNNSLVIMGNLPESAKKVIKDKAIALKTDIICINDYLNSGSLEINFNNLPLPGEHQKQNAALAVVAAMKILKINNPTIQMGLQNAVKNSGISGRLEYFNNNPDIILDSAHNPEGINTFINYFRQIEKKYNRRYIIFSALKDKAVDEMISVLKSHFHKFYLTELDVERKMDLDELEKLSNEIEYEVLPLEGLNTFIGEFKKNRVDECLVILGSMYLLGHVKSAKNNS